MNKSLTHFILAALVSVPAIGFTAAPIIDTVSGTVSNGQTLAISGANLMDEDKTNWHKFFNDNPNAYGYEGTSAAADGYDAGNGVAVGGKGSSAGYTSSVKLSGNQSIRFHIEGEHSSVIDNNPRADSSISLNLTPSEIYWRAYIRWDVAGGLWPTTYMKMYVGDIYLQPNVNGSGTAPSSMLVADAGLASYYSLPGGTIQNGKWYCLEVHHKNGTVFEAWMDGVRFINKFPTARVGQWQQTGLINLDGTTPAFSVDHYWDNYALSTNSRIHCSSIVEVGNKPDYATATKKYQTPVFLSDREIQIKADLSGLGSGPYYLWVTNNRQERSQAYVLGEGTQNTLSPPQNLRVLQ